MNAIATTSNYDFIKQALDIDDKANKESPELTGTVNVIGTVSANVFIGNGSQLTGIEVDGETVLIPAKEVSSDHIQDNAIVSRHIAPGSITSANVQKMLTRNIKGIIAIDKGGTGADTTRNARENLGLKALAILDKVSTAYITPNSITNNHIMNKTMSLSLIHI